MAIRSYCPIHGENSLHSQGQCISCRQEREENKIEEIFEEWKKEKNTEQMLFDLFSRIKKLENKSSFTDIIG